MITADRFGVTIHDAFQQHALWQKLKQRERVHGPWTEMGNRRDGWNADTLHRLNRKAQGHFPTEPIRMR